MPLLAMLAIFIAVYRMTVPPALDLGDLYKDVAHMFVAGMFGAWWAFRWAGTVPEEHVKFFKWTAILLSVWEVICGVTNKMTGTSVVDVLRGML